MENCIKCGAPLEVNTGKGRPAAYCSTACRRAAEMEIRRADQRLAGLENKAQELRLGYGLPDVGGKQAALVEAEIKRVEARLKLLLSVGE